MSWDAYVELCLMEKETVSGTIHNCCESAAILSAATADVWAATQNFEFLMDETDVPTSEFTHTDRVVVDEAQSLLFAIKHGGVAPSKAGLYLRGERYMVVRYDDETATMYLKKKNGGACICLTHVTVIIGTYDSKLKVASPPGEASFPQNAGLTNERVERLAAFLRNSGFCCELGKEVVDESGKSEKRVEIGRDSQCDGIAEGKRRGFGYFPNLGETLADQCPEKSVCVLIDN